ncbi:cysteine methyltransferase [Bordetella sp. H567]|uniref:methylated-DNA--[protein]-cysteine S-methyltransferase n=1 Tax=Bordetella sp. H567 TaxID=1697043 RepID=UPI00081D0BB7|nr:methylated-DNA--[protein]-cysteine S-methyltransferase [Bordetella sp. H567]AOB29630.1 cysteine methyltransferase [Bordetella sp. H567]
MTASATPLRLRVVDTPLGPMRLQAEGGALTGAWFLDQADCPPMPPDTVASADPLLDRAALELAEYFAARRREFSLPMAPRGTPFQRRVWDALRDIPFGNLESYGALSTRCAQPAAVRAVAQAVGRNPISIFIPCHRIIGSNSALTGFGGGLHRKQALLALEGHTYVTASPDAKRVKQDSGQGTLW